MPGWIATSGRDVKVLRSRIALALALGEPDPPEKIAGAICETISSVFAASCC
jgi:hypothetical protein